MGFSMTCSMLSEVKAFSGAVQGCSPTVKDRDGCTPLYCAAAWNRMEAVQKLASLGSQAGVRSSEGRTPVHVAAEQVLLHTPTVHAVLIGPPLENEIIFMGGLHRR